ncbi:DoxX family protein [Nonomuraea sp. NPDC026600]|uniref:DoxX family protein n=1 Tax=Nonomuraea sp. NPDC026600 TaxID=3155363 RepID=UPI0033EC6240
MSQDRCSRRCSDATSPISGYVVEECSPLVGFAAATGLVLFFAGAVVAHVRARAFYKLAFPGGFLALAIASLALDAVAPG